MIDINDNIISRKWQERCSKLPADVREKLAALAFRNCASLTTAEIPECAFSGCACEITYRGKKYFAGKYSGIYKK